MADAIEGFTKHLGLVVVEPLLNQVSRPYA